MPGFPKPRTDYPYKPADEIQALRRYPTQPAKADRAIPKKGPGRLLLATWNIANLGVQQRREKDHRLIAEILSWFDLVALQEVNGNLIGLREIQKHLPNRYKVLFSDPGGNNERFTFLYDVDKVGLLEEVGEVALPPKDLPDVKLPDVPGTFSGFDRSPYLAAFRSERLTFLLANVHLYFGSSREGKRGMDRRCLEAYAVGRWADLRRNNRHAYTKNILALGDFNLPIRDEKDPVYRALTRRGLELPEHSTKIGSNIRDDAHYDQMALFQGPVSDALRKSGVFDFDGAIFRGLWGDAKEEQKRFFSYVQYYISDHRPLWAEMRV